MVIKQFSNDDITIPVMSAATGTTVGEVTWGGGMMGRGRLGIIASLFVSEKKRTKSFGSNAEKEAGRKCKSLKFKLFRNK